MDRKLPRAHFRALFAPLLLALLFAGCATTTRISGSPSEGPSANTALREAAEILIKYLAIFTDADRVEALRDQGAALVAGADGLGDGAGGGGAGGMDDILIEELELGVRSYNCLKRVGVETIGDLISKTEGELSAIPNFGKKSIEEVKENLAAHCLGLRSDED